MPRKRKPSGRGYQSRRAPRIVIRIMGLGKDPLTLIQQACELREQDDYDQVWCVFDRDEVPAERFNQALVLAKQQQIKVAYSNQAFELWYLQHFHYCHTALARSDYVEKLSEQLGRPYQKNDNTLYQELLPKQVGAIQNAERLLKQYQPPNPVNDDPSTTVHELVQELNRFVQEKRFL